MKEKCSAALERRRREGEIFVSKSIHSEQAAAAAAAAAALSPSDE